MDFDQPKCDFCNMHIEEDEQLEEIHVGSPPQPDKVHINEQREQQLDHRMYSEQEQARLLMDTLKDHPLFDVRGYDRVEEVTPLDWDSDSASLGTSSGTTYESSIRDDMVAVEVTMYPESVEKEPDAEVCPTCSEMIRTLDE